jgi:hypothetical protein
MSEWMGKSQVYMMHSFVKISNFFFVEISSFEASPWTCFLE